MSDLKNDPMTGAVCVATWLSDHELNLLARALIRDDEVMDELKSAPLAKLRNAMEELRDA